MQQNPNEEKGIRLKEAIKRFLQFKSRMIGKSTREDHRNCLAAFADWRTENMIRTPLITDVNSLVARSYQSHLINKGIAPSSTNKYVCYIVQLMMFASDEGRANPITKPKPFKFPKNHHPLPATDQVKRIFQAIREGDNRFKVKRDLAMFSILSYGGIRAGALINIKIEDIDFKKKTLTVFTKGRKYHTIQINHLIIDPVKEWLADHPMVTDYLFCSLHSNYGRKLSIHSPRGLVKHYSEKANLGTRLVAHSFRHFCATTMLNNGEDSLVIAAHLGVSAKHVIETYAHPDERALRKSLQQFERF